MKEKKTIKKIFMIMLMTCLLSGCSLHNEEQKSTITINLYAENEITAQQYEVSSNIINQRLKAEDIVGKCSVRGKQLVLEIDHEVSDREAKKIWQQGHLSILDEDGTVLLDNSKEMFVKSIDIMEMLDSASEVSYILNVCFTEDTVEKFADITKKMSENH